jgi:sugar (pentulose or hexulose) kinase
VFTGVTNDPDIDRIPPTLDLNIHVPIQRWTISQSLGGLGASLEWWLTEAWQGDRKTRFAALDAELVATRSTENLHFIPLTGGHDDPATTHSGGFVGLRLNHQRSDMARAIMESGGYELRWALDALRVAQMPIERLWMVGGAAHSPYWPQILANITGIPIQLPDYDNWPALGAALLAGVGVGIFADIPAGLSHFGKPAIEILPEDDRVRFYTDQFEAYQAACTQVRQIPMGS